MGRVNYGFIVQSVIFFIGSILNITPTVLGFSLDLEQYDVINLMEYLNMSDKNTPKYRYTSGFNNHSLAVVFEDPVQHRELPETAVNHALNILSQHTDITFLATVLQEEGNSGSILTFSSGILRFLEIESRGGRDEIRFHYTHDQQIQVETFPYRLADNQWHRLAVSLRENHLTLFVDCSKIYERVIKTVDRKFTSGKLSLFLGQRNKQHALFRGYLQDVKLVSQANGYLLQCPSKNSDCPNCAQYKLMEQKIDEMYGLYKNLSIKLFKAEEHIRSLEQCDCLKSCHINGSIYKNGEIWKSDQCTLCRCKNGTAQCGNEKCLDLKCSQPVYKRGQCCPFCFMNCFYSGQYFDHGQVFKPRVCVKCVCDNGKMICEQQDPEKSCPRLKCSESERLQVQGECCPICKDTDFCSRGHDCHIDATCVNLATKYVCQCQHGFQGDGRHCEDINECLTAGGKTGHYCRRNTVCQNTVSSYKCLCPNGHEELEPYGCERSNGVTVVKLFTVWLCLILCHIF